MPPENRYMTTSDLRGRVTPAGLCQSCVLAPECMFPRLPGHPVQFCEEFRTDAQRPDPPQETVAHAAASDPALPGLCSNCDKRATCLFPKPVSGIWRCEEYE